MARNLREMPDGSVERRRYPWQKWLNGKVWELTKGEDFICTRNGFANAARDYAGRHGVKLEIKVTEKYPDKVFLRAKTPLKK